jgi:hypothetical protein
LAHGQVTLTVPPQRFRVLHLHLFKNGGSTIESILSREFAGRFATVHGPAADSTLTGEDIASYFDKNPEITALSSHHFRYPLPALRNTVFFDVCFLRHPLERLQSMYCFLRQAGRDEPLSRKAKDCSAREFFWRLMDHSPHLLSNVQVQQLANAGRFTRPASGDDLDRAARIVREMAVPGVVEAFDESLTAAEYFLQPAFPGIRLHYVPQNVRQTSGSSVADPGRLRESWGEDTYQDLLRVNALDFKLHDIACDEVQRRFSLVPRGSARMAELRARSRSGWMQSSAKLAGG